MKTLTQLVEEAGSTIGRLRLQVEVLESILSDLTPNELRELVRREKDKEQPSNMFIYEKKLKFLKQLISSKEYDPNKVWWKEEVTNKE